MGKVKLIVSPRPALPPDFHIWGIWIQWCADKLTLCGETEEPWCVASLDFHSVSVFPPWPLSSYQHEVTDCRVWLETSTWQFQETTESSSKFLPQSLKVTFSLSHVFTETSYQLQSTLGSLLTQILPPSLSFPFPPPFPAWDRHCLLSCPLRISLLITLPTSRLSHHLHMAGDDWKINLPKVNSPLCDPKPSMDLLLTTK